MFAQLSQEIGWFLESEEECKNWLLEMVDAISLKRAEIEAIDPNQPGSAEKAQRLTQAFLMAAGSAQGTVAALQRTRNIPTALAEELHLRVLASLVAKTQDAHVPIIIPG
jgi:hypothetical protein